MYSKIITAVVLSAVFVAPAMAATPHQSLVGHSHGATVAHSHGQNVTAPHGALVTHGGSKIATKTH